jgi:glycosyltransferase involved in cell wall biosynthesis
MQALPVVGARMGGIPGLVRHGVNGLVYDAFSIDALRVCLQQLVDDRALVDELALGVPDVKTIEEDARQWDARYLQVTGRNAATVITAAP